MTPDLDASTSSPPTTVTSAPNKASESLPLPVRASLAAATAGRAATSAAAARATVAGWTAATAGWTATGCSTAAGARWMRTPSTSVWRGVGWTGSAQLSVTETGPVSKPPGAVARKMAASSSIMA